MKLSIRKLSALPPLVLALAALTITSVVLLVASRTPPQEEALLAMAEAAVERASTPETVAHAPAELRRAREKLTAAQEALASGDTVSASQLGELAEIDARVAELHAQTMRNRQAARGSQTAAR